VRVAPGRLAPQDTASAAVPVGAPGNGYAGAVTETRDVRYSITSAAE